MTTHKQYMQRCLELAKRGAGHVAPNPMVGAVLVKGDTIIGEGWHQVFGGPHAEVNCINQATNGQAAQSGQTISLTDTTLYVSLEPCAHFGKTPPCTDLIIKHKIPRVVIGCRDPFVEVNGRGIEKLKAAGITVEVGVLEQECAELNKRFFTFHTKHRPYVILKWAETKDGFMAPPPPESRASPNPSKGEAFASVNPMKLSDVSGSVILPSGGEETRLLISNEYSGRLVHQWRAEEAAILVGTNTALCDNPELTTRLWPGPSPLRLVVDMDLKLPASLKIFDQQVPTVVFNTIKHSENGNLRYYKVSKDQRLVRQILNALYELKIQSVIVEGGAGLLQSFIDEGIWDEARVITNEDLIINNGLNVPIIPRDKKLAEQKFLNDTIVIYLPSETFHDAYLTSHDLTT